MSSRGGHKEDDALEIDTGSNLFDFGTDQLILMPQLLISPAARINFTPRLLTKMIDNWQKGESTDASIVVLKLTLLRNVLQQDTDLLEDLHEETQDKEIGEADVKVPKEEFQLYEETKQIKKTELLAHCDSKIRWLYPDILGLRQRCNLR